MKGFTRSDQLFSLCGLNCGLCPMQLDGYCPGCGGGEGNQSCKIARCSMEHDRPEYCSQCGLYPCEKYDGIDQNDSFITHQNRRRDLEKQREIGAERYRAEQQEKRELLKWLLENCNDGRKKSFFCVAVNLLETEELQKALERIRAEEGFQSASVKEKGDRVKKSLEEIAGGKQLLLKLRRKK